MLLPLALLAFAPLAADKPAPKKPDKDRIQGTWVYVALEEGGKDVTREKVEELKKKKLTFKGDSCTFAGSAFGPQVLMLKRDPVVTFKLDPDKKPAALDLEVNIYKKGVLLCVYEFVNDDTLRICAKKPDGEERPKELTSKGGQAVITLKRERKRPEK
jgi:uncharacterized protein (TIGR03067 family)